MQNSNSLCIAKNILSSLIVLILFFSLPIYSSAKEISQGESLFIQNCSGCHIDGGNIIRRRKTLKLNDLKRNGFDSAEAIAEIARNGSGIMIGYEKVLGDGGDQLVADWVWSQAQKAWIHG